VTAIPLFLNDDSAARVQLYNRPRS